MTRQDTHRRIGKTTRHFAIASILVALATSALAGRGPYFTSDELGNAATQPATAAATAAATTAATTPEVTLEQVVLILAPGARVHDERNTPPTIRPYFTF